MIRTLLFAALCTVLVASCSRGFGVAGGSEALDSSEPALNLNLAAAQNGVLRGPAAHRVPKLGEFKGLAQALYG